MVETETYLEKLKLETGWLCLDFANTANWHASDRPQEELNSYADLVGWARRVGVLTEPTARRLLQEATSRLTEAALALDQAIALREAIYRIFSSMAGGRPANTDDVELLNTALSEGLVWLRLVPMTDRLVWGWAGDETALDRMLWPAARSAAELLTSEEVDRVKECADDHGCGYLFFDTSRNRSRRWCDMKSCGNRAKVRRHRRRKHATDDTE